MPQSKKSATVALLPALAPVISAAIVGVTTYMVTVAEGNSEVAKLKETVSNEKDRALAAAAAKQEVAVADALKGCGLKNEALLSSLIATVRDRPSSGPELLSLVTVWCKAPDAEAKSAAQDVAYINASACWDLCEAKKGALKLTCDDQCLTWNVLADNIWDRAQPLDQARTAMVGLCKR